MPCSDPETIMTVKFDPLTGADSDGQHRLRLEQNRQCCHHQPTPPATSLSISAAFENINPAQVSCGGAVTGQNGSSAFSWTGGRTKTRPAACTSFQEPISTVSRAHGPRMPARARMSGGGVRHQRGCVGWRLFFSSRIWRRHILPRSICSLCLWCYVRW
jgi:hypothetical protein